MTTPDLISGGYFLIKPKPRDGWHPAHLVRDPTVSASHCLQDGILPDFEWYSNRGDRCWLMETAPRLGLTEAEGDRIDAWCNATASSSRVRWPSLFPDIAALRELIGVIGRVPAGFIAIGIALPRELVARMPAAQLDVHEQLEAALLPAPGQDLGWEVLSKEHQHAGFHSWLCNWLEDDAEKRFGIIPNTRGFIDRYDDALKVATECTEHAEPGVWLPWLITQYELS